MATDFTAELSENILSELKPTLPPGLGFQFTGNDTADLQKDHSSSDIGPSPSAALTASKERIDSERHAVGRLPEYHASVFDIFKKICRAERFGIPVQLSEAEKRFSRAERFGIDSVCGTNEMEKVDDLKRKARAERLELLTLSMATDEVAKKKARLARFAPFS